MKIYFYLKTVTIFLDSLILVYSHFKNNYLMLTRIAMMLFVTTKYLRKKIPISLKLIGMIFYLFNYLSSLPQVRSSSLTISACFSSVNLTLVL